MRLNIINNHPHSQADPFIFEDNGFFYIYATGIEGHGVSCYKSNSLTGDYTYIGDVFNYKGHKNYWAPSVIKVNDVIYMYVSCVEDKEKDSHLQTMVVATSKTPEGPFEIANDCLIEPFSIDSHPVINESGMYLFYSLNDYKATKAGTRIVVDKLVSPTKVANTPVLKVAPSIKEEIYTLDKTGNGNDWYTIEGACYFRINDYHYLLYSANCYQGSYYYVSYAVAHTSENDLRKIEFKKYPSDDIYSPLLSSNEFETGTGHNSVIEVNGEYYIVYHGRDKDEVLQDYDIRSMRIAKLIIDKEKIIVERKK